MPELPEVEAVRRGIEAQLVGRVVDGYELTLLKLIEAPAGLSLHNIIGQPITGVERRGKYLAILFPALAAMLHLKLAGQVVLRDGDTPGFAAGHPVPAFDAELPHKSTHLTLHFDNGANLYITDIRHFARLQLMPVDDLSDYWARLKLGPDARTPAFTRGWLTEALAKRRQARIKPLLLDQRFLAGLGNIYVDECLHRARIHPERLAAGLSDLESDALYEAIVDILDIAVPIGGAEILNGKAIPDHGMFPFIHGREGAECLQCGGTIIKTRVNNRGTYLCTICQPASQV